MSLQTPEMFLGFSSNNLVGQMLKWVQQISFHFFYFYFFAFSLLKFILLSINKVMKRCTEQKQGEEKLGAIYKLDHDQ